MQTQFNVKRRNLRNRAINLPSHGRLNEEINELSTKKWKFECIRNQKCEIINTFNLIFNVRSLQRENLLDVFINVEMRDQKRKRADRNEKKKKKIEIERRTRLKSIVTK